MINSPLVLVLIIFGILCFISIIVCCQVIISNNNVNRIKKHTERQQQYNNYCLLALLSHPELIEDVKFQKIILEINENYK